MFLVLGFSRQFHLLEKELCLPALWLCFSFTMESQQLKGSDYKMRLPFSRRVGDTASRGSSLRYCVPEVELHLSFLGTPEPAH